MTKKIKLKIDGMHCASCAMNIDGELEDVGVKNVCTSYAKAEAEVEYDEQKIQLEDITRSIEDLGYKTRLKSA